MEYLKVWTSFLEVMEPLGDAERGRLFTAMLKYAETGEVPEFSGNERFTWPSAKQAIDQMALKNEKLRENGLLGGRPKNQTKPNETKENQTKANESLKVNVNDKDKVTIKEIPSNEGTKKSSRFSPPTLEEVTAYCRERGNAVNAQRFVDFYAAKGWKVGNQPMKDWKAAVRTWEQRDSQQATQAPVKKPPAAQYQQREYTEEQMRAFANNPLLKYLEEDA